MERLNDLKEFDSLPLTERFSRTQPLWQRRAEFEASGDTESAKILCWECLVLDDSGILRVHSLEPQPDRDSHRHSGLVRLRSDTEAVDYFISQVDQCSNPLNRALYCNFIWESLHDRRDRNAYQWGQRAARVLIDAARYVAKANWGQECVACLCRSVELSMLLSDGDAARTWLDEWEGTFEHLDDDRKRRWQLEVIEAILVLQKSRMGDVVNKETLRRLASIAEQSLSYYTHQTTMSQVAIRFAELASRIHRALDETRRAEEFILRKCQVFEQQIEYALVRGSAVGGTIIASHEAAMAIAAYQDAYSQLTEPDLRAIADEKIEALKLRVRDLNRQAADELPLFQVAKIDIPDLFEPTVETLFSSNRAFWMDLLREHFASPSLDEIEKETKRLAGGLSDWLPVRTSVGDRSLGFDEPETFRRRQFYELRIRVHVYGLMYVFGRMHHLGVNLMSYLRREIEQKLPDREDVLCFFDAAVYYWQNNEYIAGLHVLAPLCERLFKAMVERAKVSILLGQQQGKQEEASLGKLLDKDLSPKVCQLLNPDLIHFLRYAWVDEPGHNLRNRIAHGWVRPDECNWYTMMLLFWTVIHTLGIEPSE